MALQKITGAKIDRAMNWAEGQERLIENDYYDGYSALRNLFDKLDLNNEQDLMGAAYAIYGWMPTILKKEPKAAELAKLVLGWRNSAKRKDVLNELRDQPHITQAINGSTVGTSKFLHFVAPDIFPIWDSNIALVFGITSKINDPATYLDYCDAIHNRLDDTAKPVVWPMELRELKDVTDVRKMEFCLYAYGKHCRSFR
jgi:hypothetical protein